MSLCVSCGLRLSGTRALCPHHVVPNGDDWAKRNRIMCDLFHRKKEPPAPLPNEYTRHTDDEGDPIVDFNRYYARIYAPAPRRPLRPERTAEIAAFNAVGASWEEFRATIEADRRRLWQRHKTWVNI